MDVVKHEKLEKSMSCQIKLTTCLPERTLRKGSAKNTDEAIKLPIDVANFISPILYEIAEEGDLPFDTMLWALISKKIADRGADYCS